MEALPASGDDVAECGRRDTTPDLLLKHPNTTAATYS
jgi:hypothetical protein